MEIEVETEEEFYKAKAEGEKGIRRQTLTTPMEAREEEWLMFVIQDDDYSRPCCRICHEAEFESQKALEAPCVCSGTAKFAHRDCIQRWCNEKGNTTCEICLKNYEPGYAAPPISKKVQLIEEEEGGATMRDTSRSQSPRAVQGFLVDDDEDYSECTAAADRAVSCCRSFALTLTVFLLLRHVIDVLAGRPEQYPFTLLTVLVLRMSGIVVPMLVVFRTITAVKNRIRRRYRVMDAESSREDDTDEESDRQRQHIV